MSKTPRHDNQKGTIMPKTMWEQCQMIKLTSAQFEEGMGQGWPQKDPGTAIVQMRASLAKLILTRQIKNRPLKPHNKAKIVASIREQYWRLNGEPIILTREFAALDGHHRLEAFAEMEPTMTVEVVISWGWAEDCFDTIDIGVKRSGGDVYHADGESNSVLLSAAARYDWRITRKDMLSGNQLPEPLMRQYRDDHPGLKAAMTWADKIDHLIPKGMAVALFYRFSQKDAALAKEFYADVSKGENINSREHTAWHLRDLLMLRHHARLQLSNSVQAQLAANVIKAWNGVRAKKVLTRRSLTWQGEAATPEPFPEIR